jgi:hypothetical protein
VNALPVSGRFIVDTESDTYDVDVDSRLAVWHDMAREAAGLHTEPRVFLFDTVECSVGEAMVFDADSWPRVTPRVLGITPVHAEVTA